MPRKQNLGASSGQLVDHDADVDLVVEPVLEILQRIKWAGPVVLNHGPWNLSFSPQPIGPGGWSLRGLDCIVSIMSATCCTIDS